MDHFFKNIINKEKDRNSKNKSSPEASGNPDHGREAKKRRPSGEQAKKEAQKNALHPSLRGKGEISGAQKNDQRAERTSQNPGRPPPPKNQSQKGPAQSHAKPGTDYSIDRGANNKESDPASGRVSGGAQREKSQGQKGVKQESDTQKQKGRELVRRNVSGSNKENAQGNTHGPDQKSTSRDVVSDRQGTKRDIREKGDRDLQDENGKKIRIGDRLVSMGLITENQLGVALQEQKINGGMLGKILVSLGFIDDNTLSTFLAESTGYDVFDPRKTIVDADVLARLPKEEAYKYQILPISMSEDVIYVATADPYDVVAFDNIRKYFPKNLAIETLVTTPSVLSDAIDALYGYSSNIEDILKELETGEKTADVTDLDEEEAYAHPIVRLVNALLSDAVKLGASDIHIEPEETFLRVRYRVDGVLSTAHIFHNMHKSPITQRVKIISGMNIADKLAPQDGRVELKCGARIIDYRVSCLPTIHGENIVMRVLDKTSSIIPLEDLGFSSTNLDLINKAQGKPEGIIIVTGPTGSGKTTSLYSMINKINGAEINIQTLENPVEYSLPIIRQTQVKEGVLSFAQGIRAMLRQDPDVVFIGEIRDNETAGMAIQAAMTGHQVYTTLHTNDSFAAFNRLLDLGIKPGMIAGSIIAVFAQRLARKLCNSCKVEYEPGDEEKRLLGIDTGSDLKIYHAKQGGCQQCGGQGYSGRIAIAEILLMDEELDEIVENNGGKAELKRAAYKKGFKSLREDGIIKIREGICDIPSIAKIVSLEQ